MALSKGKYNLSMVEENALTALLCAVLFKLVSFVTVHLDPGAHQVFSSIPKRVASILVLKYIGSKASNIYFPNFYSQRTVCT